MYHFQRKILKFYGEGVSPLNAFGVSISLAKANPTLLISKILDPPL